MDYFWLLPGDCLSEILSFTSPEDTARLSTISRGFNSAAESDVVWEKFLPDDYQHIISNSKSSYLLDCSSKKELYFSLCDSPILTDGGKLSFSLDKKTGKKCFMVSARELIISWPDTQHYLAWPSDPHSRFSEVAHLRFACWFDMRGKIETQLLSKRTKYVVYLVYKLACRFYGLETANAFVRFVDCESDNEAEERASVVNLSRQGAGQNRSKGRDDGWFEIELGNFFNGGEDGDVEARLVEVRRLFAKSDLIIQGIEFRPE